MQHEIQIIPKLIPIFSGDARYRLAHGGRGSGKTRTFAKMLAVRAVIAAQAGIEGIMLCGREYMNSLSDSSFAEIKFAILEDEFLSREFDVGERYIRTKCKRVNFSFQGLRNNIDSIKSKARILILWIDEAETVSEECWVKVIPTVREIGSEIWVTWNPERDGSATDKRFLKTMPKNANWSDNPWFPGTALEQERLDDLEKRPDQYGHIWEGEYLQVKSGAYFTSQILKAKSENRWLIDLHEDPLMTIRLHIDIGGTGAKADNFVIWVSQFIGDRINFIDHYETQGQPIGSHLDWLRSRGYGPDRAQIWLPHDGETNDRVLDVSYKSAFETAGYYVEVVKNQGKGAAMQRVESIRNNFNRFYFDKKCEAGTKAIAWYHEKVCENRNVGLGPNHDWSSHSCDSLGLASITYAAPGNKKSSQSYRVNTA